MEMTLTTTKELQILPSDPVTSTALLPILYTDTLFPSMERLPMYTLMHGQVMTDEQLETLRRQISVYATICQQLVEMHKAIMAQQSAISGLRLGQSMPYDPSMNSAGHKLTSRQRWTPSQTQLQILERLFQQGNGTPSKQKIKEITAELIQHGQISETNVYNWFQNRRARTKRKQQLGAPNTGESEVDTDVDSPQEKKVKIERDLLCESSGTGQTDMHFQNFEGAVLVGQATDLHRFTQNASQPAKLLAQAGTHDAQGNNGTGEPMSLAHAGEKYTITGSSRGTFAYVQSESGNIED